MEISTPNVLDNWRAISCKGRLVKINSPFRQAISSATRSETSRVMLFFSLLYIALSFGFKTIRTELLLLLTATEPSSSVVFTFRIVRIGLYVKVSAQYLYIDRLCLYDERVFPIFRHFEIRFSFQVHFPVFSLKLFGIGE